MRINRCLRFIDRTGKEFPQSTPKRGKVYSFGDVVKVKITNIDLLKREIDFVIV
jgi:exoribonuclease R